MSVHPINQRFRDWHTEEFWHDSCTADQLSNMIIYKKRCLRTSVASTIMVSDRNFYGNSDEEYFSPLSFIREAICHFDSAGATNKIQFMLSGLRLLVATGKLNVFHALHMTVRHTKPGLIHISRSFTGGYNVEDTINHAMMNSAIENYSEEFVYSGHIMESWSCAHHCCSSLWMETNFQILHYHGKWGRGKAKCHQVSRRWRAIGLKGCQLRRYLVMDILGEMDGVAERSLVTSPVPHFLDVPYERFGNLHTWYWGFIGSPTGPTSVKAPCKACILYKPSEADKMCIEVGAEC